MGSAFKPKLQTGSRRPSPKTLDFVGCSIKLRIRQSRAPKCRKFTGISPSRLSCSHSNMIYDVQLQTPIVLRTQPRHQGTLTQPLQYDLQTLHCKTSYKYAQQRFYQTQAFTQRNCYTEERLHTGAFTHRSFYTEERLHTEDPDRVPSRSGQNLKSQFFISFCTLTLIFGGFTGPKAFSHVDDVGDVDDAGDVVDVGDEILCN